jgi:hypothetical protein
MEFREIKRVVRDHGGVAELLIQPTPLHQFEGGRGGVAPVSAGAHAALRSVARFIYMMCRRAGSYRPACGVSPATQAPPPLSAPPVQTRFIVIWTRESRAGRQGPSRGQRYAKVA